MNNKSSRINKVYEIAYEMGLIDKAGIQLHYNGYAEPGYNDPESGVIATGDWNRADRIMKIFEKLGVECEWSDEWTYCHECGKLVRIYPDSYSWKKSYVLVNECEILCSDCILADVEGYLTSIEGDCYTANSLKIKLDEHGYTRIVKRAGEYVKDKYGGWYCETGWYGREDDPEEIAKELREEGIERFIFNLDKVEQFRAMWSVYIHNDELNKLFGRKKKEWNQ